MRRSNVRGRPQAGTWRYIALMVALIVMSLPPGCAAINTALAPKAYEGPALPSEAVAVITTKYTEHYDGIWGTVTKILAVDGKDWGLGNAAEVLPGRHDIVLGRGSGGGYMYTYTKDTSGRLSFEATAPRLYLALSSWSGGQAWFWIEEDATGDVVAGSKPSADN